MTETAPVLLNIEDRIATITLNRPDSANGLNLALTTRLAEIAHELSGDSNVKVVILTANGRFFSAGGDIESMQNGPGSPGENVKAIANQLHRAISIFARMQAPLIVAANGTCAGAGFSLAVMGDLVVASDAAKFTMAYTKIGLSPDGSSSYYLPRIIGTRKTQELMLTNRVLSATEAKDWGLINEIVEQDELMHHAMQWASVLSQGSRQSNGQVKRLLMTSFDNTLEDQLKSESEGIAECADSEDGREGVASFIEKRTPKFI